MKKDTFGFLNNLKRSFETLKKMFSPVHIC